MWFREIIIFIIYSDPTEAAETTMQLQRARTEAGVRALAFMHLCKLGLIPHHHSHLQTGGGGHGLQRMFDAPNGGRLPADFHATLAR